MTRAEGEVQRESIWRILDRHSVFEVIVDLYDQLVLRREPQSNTAEEHPEVLRLLWDQAEPYIDAIHAETGQHVKGVLFYNERRLSQRAMPDDSELTRCLIFVNAESGPEVKRWTPDVAISREA